MEVYKSTQSIKEKSRRRETNFLKSSSETFSKESSEQSEKEQISQQDYDTFLQDFGEKFLNYSSIDERNKSVRDMFTGEARAINGLDTSVDINVEGKGKGKVKAIYRQTTEEMKYVIVGTDEANGNKNGIVLFVELMDKMVKQKLVS